MKIYFNILNYEIHDKDTFYISGPFAFVNENSRYWNEEETTFILYGQEELFKFLNDLKRINSKVLWFNEEFEIVNKQLIIKKENKDD